MHQRQAGPNKHWLFRPISWLNAATLALLLLCGHSALALDVNRANSAELQTIEGVGPVIAERILKERSRGGNFSSKADLIERVKGVGEKTAGRITSGSGLKKGSTTSNRSSSAKTSSRKAESKQSDAAVKSVETSSASKSSSDKRSKKSAKPKALDKKVKTTKTDQPSKETKKQPKKKQKKSAKKKASKSAETATKKKKKKKTS